MILSADAPLTNLVKAKGVLSWEALKTYVAGLPYRRTSDPGEISLVISEGCGTCSGKHAVLAAIARENAIPEVHLMVSVFQMNGDSHPILREVLENSRLNYIPEAHCYLLENGRIVDCTRKGSFTSDFERRILDSRELFHPENVADEKTAYHQEFLEKWRKAQNLPYTFEELWRIRECCIGLLSK